MNRLFTILILYLFVLVTKARTVIIGDSLFQSGSFFYFKNSPLVERLIEKCGHKIENYAKNSASLEQGWVQSIPDQYHGIKDKSTITTLIMDGGGNDVLSHRSDCEAWNENCIRCIDKSIQLADQLFHEADSDGIQNIIYLGFYYLSGLQKASDYANPMLIKKCQEASIPCFYVDPRYNETTSSGLKTPELLGNDQIHPRLEGYNLLADMIWNVVLQHNITL